VTPGALERIRAALVAADALIEIRGTLPPDITTITDDSRRVDPGALFIAVRGAVADGHDYLDAAAAQGAGVALVEEATRAALPALVVRDGRRAAAIAAAAAYGHPARDLTLIAVTGTNGKTTTVGLLRHVLDTPTARAASIGTLGVLIGSEGTMLPGGQGLTTPGPIEVQRLLRALLDAGVRTVAMETSSHALHQSRVEGLHFAAALFTNFTRDHLDYHRTMEEYFAAKARLVGHLAVGGTLVVNADDSAWAALPDVSPRVTFGVHTDAVVRAAHVTYGPTGSQWTLTTPTGTAPVSLPVIGDFNVANAVGAAAVAYALGHAVAHIADRLGSVPQVAGRLERIASAPLVLRDYAHTPDALERALAAARPCVPGGRLIVVFGCGGDRDPGKRPLMGGIAQRDADVAILTSDNPRTEDPERILDDIAAGMTAGAYERIADRRDAIARALAIADPTRDLVLLAGKGHETYQIRGTTTVPFDEAAIVAELLDSSV
jgi:UDP-N-acetylmuramoyl-L-alanyl-D-glutamate--2,6-diaminopimelate ligase